MTIDLNTYAVNRRYIQDWYRNSDVRDEDLCKSIAEWSASLSCPCIALAFYVGELNGYVPVIRAQIDRLIVLYGYSEILNQLPGSPYLTTNDGRDIK